MVIAVQATNFEMEQQQQQQLQQLQQQQQQQQQQHLPLHFLLPLLQPQNPLANVATPGNASASSSATQFHHNYDSNNFNDFYANNASNNNNSNSNYYSYNNTRFGQNTQSTSPASNLSSAGAGISFKLALQQQQQHQQQQQEAIFQQLYNQQNAALNQQPQQNYLHHTVGSTLAATSSAYNEHPLPRTYPQVNNTLYYRAEQPSNASNTTTSSVTNYPNFDNTLFSSHAGSDDTSKTSSPAKPTTTVMTRQPAAPPMQVTEYSLSLKTRSACDECSRTKVKCSGSPICARCTKRGLTCTFSQTKKRGPKNKKAGYYFNQIPIQAPPKKQYIKPIPTPAKSPPRVAPPPSFYQEFKN